MSGESFVMSMMASAQRAQEMCGLPSWAYKMTSHPLSLCSESILGGMSFPALSACLRANEDIASRMPFHSENRL